MRDAERRNDDWQSPDRVGANKGSLALLAKLIARTCGLGRTLDVGTGEGVLVQELLRQSIDAFGVDASEPVLRRANARVPGRFVNGSILRLPFRDGEFETLASTGCMEYIAEQDVAAGLRELYRVSRRFVFLELAATPDDNRREDMSVRDRRWWERRCFDAGFRKHPAYYRINSYENLERDGRRIMIPLEKVPHNARNAYPLESLQAERGLHMDMSRETGDRSDAHMVRYHLASEHVRPGDRVLDAACGLGYGSHLLSVMARPSQVVGIDDSKYAIDYANGSFGATGKVGFATGRLPDALTDFDDHSFDVVVCFETLEHVLDPAALLSGFRRILTPGGRIIVSVPNDWSDDSGQDPNLHHLHVYDWNRLAAQISAEFILERSFLQIATQCKIAASGHRWELRPRTLREIPVDAKVRPDSEWWLLVGMKSPFDFHADAKRPAATSPAMTYVNPWLEKAMVHIGYRLRNSAELLDMAERVRATAPETSNDHLAALCVSAYRVLDDVTASRSAVDETLRQIASAVGELRDEPQHIRWRVSLGFVAAALERKVGRLAESIAGFERCADIDALGFSVHLMTKTTEALFSAGLLAYAINQPERCRALWTRTIALGSRLLSVRLDDILIDCARPNLFDHGDGIREYCLAWDFLARAANGLTLLKEDGGIGPAQLDTLLNSFSAKQQLLQGDLASAQQLLLESTGELNGLGTAQTALRQAIEARSDELIATRKLLVERTEALEAVSADLKRRTEDLVDVRETLHERSTVLERTCDELIATRKLLLERTEALERISADQKRRTEDLVDVRKTLHERSAVLERTGDELITTRKLLLERTEALERTSADLRLRTENLVDVRKTLHERSAVLERTGDELVRCTAELVQTRTALVERSGLVAKISVELAIRTSELVEVRQLLVERTNRLGQDLLDRTADLVATRAALVERTVLLEEALARSLEKPPRPAATG